MTDRRTMLPALVAVALLIGATESAAQSVANRTPNLTGGWTAAPGVVQFNFVHRFELSDAPLRKLTNYPTFLIGTGITDRTMVGLNYAPNSTLVPAFPNEWEFFGRALPLSQTDGAPVDVSLQAGYNVASQSADAELLVARDFGRARILAAGRYFSDAFDTPDDRVALAGGASIRLATWLAIAGDYSVLLNERVGEEAAWGVGLQLGVPYTPHSFSIQVTNVNSTTLAGSSIGTGVTRVGFEYTVPITVARYFGGRGSPESTDEEPMAGEPMMDMRDEGIMDAPTATDTVRISISQFRYGDDDELEIAPHTMVVWINDDPVAHSVTADDASFDSELIQSGDSWSHVFAEAGTYAYHCTPHPFMRASVVVTDDSME